MLKSETNERLDYPADTRLLIINADDFGMCHSTHMAIFRSLTEGAITSMTLMAACPWAPQAMRLLAHSSTAQAHHLQKTDDWVVIDFKQDDNEHQCTIVTETKGTLSEKRVVRGSMTPISNIIRPVQRSAPVN